MKTKIAAAVLAAVLLLHVGGEFTRAKATGAAVAGIAAIGILAFNLLGVMTGQYDDTAEGINCFIENGVEGWQNAFVGTEDTPSWFASGWQQIYDTCSGWFDSGEITIDGDNVSLKYSQYVQLCELLTEIGADLKVDLGTIVDYHVFNYAFGDPVPVSAAPKFDTFYTKTGVSYIPIYYDSNKIYFSRSYFRLYFIENSNSKFDLNNRTSYINSDFSCGDNSSYIFGGFSSEIGLDTNQVCFFYNCPELIISMNGSNHSYNPRYDSWFCYDGIITSVSTDTIDTSSLTSGYLAVSGHPESFFKGLSYYSATLDSPVDDLFDTLQPVLEKTTDPTLVIDTDPAIVNPIDSVTVTDIPGTNDVPLSQLKEKTKVDIDIPSLIADKFPFCIPFDFIRIIGVLCADPVAPVFRIPISTNPENLEAFEGNQTIGDFPEDYKPMFEIDEEIVIDLSCIPLVQPICYTIFILGFVILLIYITPKMINH